jgi:hypothetical protein
MGGGYPNGVNFSSWTATLDIAGNTFGGLNSTFQKNFPANTFLTRADFDLLIPAR